MTSVWKIIGCITRCGWAHGDESLKRNPRPDHNRNMRSFGDKNWLMQGMKTSKQCNADMFSPHRMAASSEVCIICPTPNGSKADPQEFCAGHRLRSRGNGVDGGGGGGAAAGQSFELR